MVNKAILIGNLGRDPELSYTQNGVALCKVSIATTERFSTRDGERKEQTEWHNLVFWRRQAEVANEYLRKGSRIYVEGRIRHRSWEDNDGNKKYATDIEVLSFQMLSSRGESGGGDGGSRTDSQQGSTSSSSAKPQQDSGYRYEPESSGQGSQDFGSNQDDDLPF